MFFNIFLVYVIIWWVCAWFFRSWFVLRITSAPTWCLKVGRCAVVARLSALCDFIWGLNWKAHIFAKLARALNHILDRWTYQRVLAAEWELLLCISDIWIDIVLDAWDKPRVAKIQTQAHRFASSQVSITGRTTCSSAHEQALVREIVVVISCASRLGESYFLSDFRDVFCAAACAPWMLPTKVKIWRPSIVR